MSVTAENYEHGQARNDH